jgi:Fe2+ transport system protein FeoA
LIFNVNLKVADMTLLELKAGQCATIKDVLGSGPVRQRLLDMGLLPECLITMERIAPTGAPLWIRLDSMQLALRRNEASSILIETTQADPGTQA